MHAGTVLGILPLIALLLMVAIRCARKGLRLGVLQGFLLWGCLILVLTEGLSAFRLLTFPAVTTAWTVILVGLAFWLVRQRGGRLKRALVRLVTFAREQKFPAAAVLVISGLTLAIALAAPPNNWDSMTSYMAKVSNWVQNGRVDHYPSYTSQQLFAPPLAGYGILHCQILASGDRFANLIQWVSMAGALFGVAAITKELGGSDKAAAFAALFAAAVPMGILQASSTQTDYAVTVWAVIFVYFLLRGLRDPSATRYLQEGLALGLAAMTKSTGLILAVPLLLWQACSAIRRQRLRAIPGGAIIVVCALVTSATYLGRNVRTFGHPFTAPRDSRANKNERIGPGVTVSNLARNATFHVGTIEPVNRRIYNALDAAHRWVGLDVQDPATTKNGPFRLRSFNTHEDLTGNLAHFALILLALILMIGWRRVRGDNRQMGLAVALLAGVILFCSFLKWSPWRQRLHLPWFVLFGPVAAIALERLGKRKLTVALSILLAAGSVPWLLWNASRPVFDMPGLTRGTRVFQSSRTEQYFANRKSLRADYVGAFKELKSRHCHHLALVYGTWKWEYPVWVLARKELGEFRIVKPLARGFKPDAAADAIDAWVYIGEKHAALAEKNPRLGRPVYRSDYVSVFLPKS